MIFLIETKRKLTSLLESFTHNAIITRPSQLWVKLASFTFAIAACESGISTNNAYKIQAIFIFSYIALKVPLIILWLGWVFWMFVRSGVAIYMQGGALEPPLFEKIKLSLFRLSFWHPPPLKSSGDAPAYA